MGVMRLTKDSKALSARWVFTGLALLVTLVMASQYVTATWRLGMIVGSSTVVGADSTCSGSWRVIAIPDILDVNDGDSVAIWHNATYRDNRFGSGNPTAYHNFTLDVDYLGTKYSDTYKVQTTGSIGGAHTLSVTPTVQQNTWMFVNWTYSVIIPGVCQAGNPGDMQRLHLV